MANLVITIGRENGSGGRQLGSELAEALGVKCYDSELINETAKASGFAESFVQSHEEQRPGSFLYSLVTGGGVVADEQPFPVQIFQAQSEVIRTIAARESCVIVGRCADYVLRDDPNVALVNLFVHAPMAARIRRESARTNTTPIQAEKRIRQVDKERASYYNFFSSKRWGDAQGYDLCVIDLNDLEARKEEENTTAALLRGECAAFTQRGAKLAGLDVYISSNVPKGSGVSSSAAFEVLIGVILNDCFMTEKVSPIAIAQIGQWAENVYFGKPCGLMDQMASSVGNIITIDFASPAKPVVEPVAVDFSKAGLALCILDSGADHADLTDEYAAIPAECRAVAAVCGGEVLRDVPFETFLAKLPECRRQCGDRAVLRAFHVYADNDRVAKQVAALHDGDFGTFLSLVNESGCSSWEYLQNVIPAGYKEHQEVGVTIAAAKHLLGDKGAVRVHGGGFAGTVQAFVPVEMLDEFKAGMEAILGEGRCHVLSIRPEGGAVL